MANAFSLEVNVLPVKFSFNAVTLWQMSTRGSARSKDLREQHKDHWHVQWADGVTYVLPIVENAPEPTDAKLIQLNAQDMTKLLPRLVTDAIIHRFPNRKPLREKPVEFLAINPNAEIMVGAREALPLNHPLLAEFFEWPRYSFDCRQIEVQDDKPFMGITVTLGTAWEISAGLGELAQTGVDLRGLYVISRESSERPRLVGRIESVRGDRVRLRTPKDGYQDVAANSVMLEGHPEAQVRCLKTLLGQDAYQRYKMYRDKRVEEVLGGPAFYKTINDVASVLKKAPLNLAVGLTCSTGDPVSITNTSDHLSIVHSKQLDYHFDTGRGHRTPFPWRGLEKYGPFSRGVFAIPSPRILVVYPAMAKSVAETFTRVLRDGVPGQDAFALGMVKTFGLVDLKFDFASVEPGRGASERYRHVIEHALEHEGPFDAALVIPSDEDGEPSVPNNSYWRSKETFLSAGIPSQAVRLATIDCNPTKMVYSLQNIALALYSKMNGVPWTVGYDEHGLTVQDELVIGIGTAEISDSRLNERQRYVGITTVFQGDGSYLLGNLTREVAYSKYPAMLRESTRNVINEIKRRNGWKRGDTIRLVFHASRPPKNRDFSSLMRAAVGDLGDEQYFEFAFLTVSHDHPFRLFDLSEEGKAQSNGKNKGKFVPNRGLIVQIRRNSRLVCTTGPQLVKRAELPLPRPVQVDLHPNSTFTDLQYLSEQVLKFTNLSSRSRLPSADPVTIYYSKLMAEQIGKLKQIPGWSPLNIHVRLRSTRWFI